MVVEKCAVLYGFWLSSCTWRVRAALHLKRIPYEERNVDIAREQSQLTKTYRDINPSQKVPALVIDGVTLVESMAILQYLEETRPVPTLTPAATPLLRARARELCETIVSGIQPLQNIGLKSHLPTESHFTEFTKYWTLRGLETIEDLLKRSAGQYCVGDQLSFADLCLVPQLYNAVTRHELELVKYPTASKLYERLLNEKVFSETHPNKAKLRKNKFVTK